MLNYLRQYFIIIKQLLLNSYQFAFFG